MGFEGPPWAASADSRPLPEPGLIDPPEPRTPNPPNPNPPAGIAWSERSSYCQNIPDTTEQPPYNPSEQYVNFDCVVPLNSIYWVYVALWAGYLVLAIYFDNILPNENGVRR